MGRWSRWAGCLLLLAVLDGAWAQGQYVRDLLVCQSVSGKGQPVLADTWFAAGTTSLTAWFRTLDLPPGTEAEVRWLLHGATLSAHQVKLVPNRFATDRLSLGMGEALPSGTYEVRVTVNGMLQARAVVKVGGIRPVTPDQPVVTPPGKSEPTAGRPAGLARATRTSGIEAATAVAPPVPVTAPAPQPAGPAGTPAAPVTSIAPTPPGTLLPPAAHKTPSPGSPPPLIAPDLPPVPAPTAGGPAHALDVAPAAPEVVSAAAPVAPTGAAAPAPVPAPVTMPVPTAPAPRQGEASPAAPPSALVEGTVAAPAAAVTDGPAGSDSAPSAPAGVPLGPRTASGARPTPLVGGSNVRPAPAETEPLFPPPLRPAAIGGSPLAAVRAEAPVVPASTPAPLAGGGGRSAARALVPTAEHMAPAPTGVSVTGARPVPREAGTETADVEAPLAAPPVAPVTATNAAGSGAVPVSPVTPPAVSSGPPVPAVPEAPISPGGAGATSATPTGRAEEVSAGAATTLAAPASGEATVPLPGGPVTPPPSAAPKVTLRPPLTSDAVAEDLLPVAVPKDAVHLYLVNLVPVTEPEGLQPLWLMRMPDGRIWPPTIGSGFGLYAGEAPSVSPADLLVYSDHQDGVVPLYEVPRDEAVLHAVRENQATVLCMGRDIYDMRRKRWQETAGAWRWTWLARQVDVQAGDTVVGCLTNVGRSQRAPEDFVPTSHEELFLLDEKGKRVKTEAIGPDVAAQVAASLGVKTEGADMATLLGALSDQGVVGLSAWKVPAAGRYQVWAALPFDKSRATAKVWTSGK